MRAKIKEKQTVAEDTLKVVLQVQEDFPKFKAGQYFFITLPDLKYPDDRGSRRQFSIVNSPNEKGILTLTTRLSDSGFKKTLSQLPVGAEVEVGPIAGILTLPESFKQPLVFIAGGIGITPFISMIRYVAEEKLPAKIMLIYSNRNQASTAYLDEVQSLAEQIPDFKLVLSMTDDPNWQGERRRVDEVFLKQYSGNLQNPLFYVVGPPPMTEAVSEALQKLGIEELNIKVESFTGYS